MSFKERLEAQMAKAHRTGHTTFPHGTKAVMPNNKAGKYTNYVEYKPSK